MSIGEALAQARRRAGLTLPEVSRRTRVRQTLIAGIEADDFAPCGGDFYARGHIRAIAKAVGLDPAPLIAEYDARHGAPGWILPADPQGQPQTPEAPGPGGPGRHGGDLPEGQRLGPEHPDPEGPGGGRPEPGRAPHEGRHADDDTDVLGAVGPAPGPRQRRANVTLVLAVALVVVLGFLIYRLIPGSTGVAARNAGGQASSHRAVQRSAPATRASRARASASAAPSPTASPPPVAAAQALRPVRATAFGSSGPGNGDNPPKAALAIDGSPATSWHTDWYTTPNFGGLYTGTGLLLDMGSAVTVTDLRITLGGSGGADLQVRVGDTPSLAALTPVARESGASGRVSVRLASPARGRYVLIWFTTLPQDSSGTYEARIYNVSLRGQP